MKRNSLSLLLGFVTAIALACGGSGGASQTPLAGSGSSFPMTVDQSDGQKLTLDKAPQRIVSLSPHASEIICAIGASAQLVAVDKFENCPHATKTKPELDSFQPSVEAITATNPDLVYVFSNQGKVVEALRRVNVPVLLLDLPQTLEGTYENIQLFGRITGHSKEANDLVTRLRKQADTVKARVATAAKGPRYFHELTADYYTLRSDTFVGELYGILKGQNVADGAASQYPQLSAETIVARDPEVIILADGESAAAVKARPGWANISAVKNSRVCVVDPDIVSRPGPRIIDGLEALGKCLYPGN